MVEYDKKLKYLMDTVRKPTGKKYRIREIAEGVDVTVGYISHIATGKRKNPSDEVLKRIANFFGVDESYFNEEIDLSNKEFSEQLALRCMGMTNQQRNMLLQAAKRIREETIEHDTAWNEDKTKSESGN